MATFERNGLRYVERGRNQRWDVFDRSGARVGDVSSIAGRQLRTGKPRIIPPRKVERGGRTLRRIGDFRRSGKGDGAPFRGKPLDWDATLPKLLSLARLLKGKGRYFVLRIGANWDGTSPKVVRRPDGSTETTGGGKGPGVKAADGDNSTKAGGTTSLMDAVLESRSWEDFTTRLLGPEAGKLDPGRPYVYALEAWAQDEQPGARR